MQSRLQTLIADKVSDSRARITELTTLVADLERAEAALAGHRPDGPCDDRCGCTSERNDLGPATPVPVAIACTLNVTKMPRRIADWRSVLDFAERRQPIDGGARVTFSDSVPLTDLVSVVTAEQQCCRFFSFAITIDERGLALEIRTPDEGREVLERLLKVAR